MSDDKGLRAKNFLFFVSRVARHGARFLLFGEGIWVCLIEGMGAGCVRQAHVGGGLLQGGVGKPLGLPRHGGLPPPAAAAAAEAARGGDELGLRDQQGLLRSCEIAVERGGSGGMMIANETSHLQGGCGARGAGLFAFTLRETCSRVKNVGKCHE
jgi:hypothetical protein